MNDTTVKFRDNAKVAVVRDAQQISIHVRGIEQPIVLEFSDLSQAVRAEAFGYGMEVRLTRAAAIEHAKAGRAATAQEKWEAIKRLAQHYASGTDSWTMSSGGGGGGLSADTRALIEALVRALDCDSDAAEATVRGLTSAQRDQLRVDPEIKPHLDAVYEERARSSGVSTSKLLEGLRKG